jgi:hypothetical protein
LIVQRAAIEIAMKIPKNSAVRKSLKVKQKTFVREYLIDLNVTAGYKQATKRQPPSTTLRDWWEMIRLRPRSRMAELSKRTEFTAD